MVGEVMGENKDGKGRRRISTQTGSACGCAVGAKDPVPCSKG